MDKNKKYLTFHQTSAYKLDQQTLSEMIHVISQTTGIEIIMDSQTETFSDFESEILYFLKNLTFG